MNADTAAAADRVVRTINDHWSGLHAATIDVLRGVTQPYPDAQVEATKRALGLPAAAELLLGKIAGHMAAVRSAAQR